MPEKTLLICNNWQLIPQELYIQCTLDIVATFIVAIRIYSGHFPGTKFVYSIIFRSDIVARKCLPKVATISEVHCICYISIMIYPKHYINMQAAWDCKRITGILYPIKNTISVFR